MSDRAWVLKYQLECDKVQWLQTHCGQTWISLGRLLYKDILFLCPRWSSGPYPGTSLYEHILWMHLEKNRTYARTFPVQRKEINVVKVRFTMMYFSRKLNNKIIATACNLWRQITCSFQVYHTGLWPHKPPWFPGAKSTRKTPWKTLFWISRFFSTWPTLTSQAVFADNFSDRSTKIRAKK